MYHTRGKCQTLGIAAMKTFTMARASLWLASIGMPTDDTAYRCEAVDYGFAGLLPSQTSVRMRSFISRSKCDKRC